MAKVTSKLQVTLPKAIADAFGIRPGDEIDWIAADNIIRVVPASSKRRLPTDERLKLFDEATRRQKRRQRKQSDVTVEERQWTREELYDRGSTR